MLTLFIFLYRLIFAFTSNHLFEKSKSEVFTGRIILTGNQQDPDILMYLGSSYIKDANSRNNLNGYLETISKPLGFAFSINFWIIASPPQSLNAPLFSLGLVSQDEDEDEDFETIEGSFEMYISPTGRIHYSDHYLDEIGISGHSKTIVANNQWRHVVFVKKGSSAFFYVDGKHTSTLSSRIKHSTSSSFFSYSQSHFCIAVNCSTSDIQAKSSQLQDASMDFRILYSRALQENEVKYLFSIKPQFINPTITFDDNFLSFHSDFEQQLKLENKKTYNPIKKRSKQSSKTSSKNKKAQVEKLKQEFHSFYLDLQSRLPKRIHSDISPLEYILKTYHSSLMPRNVKHSFNHKKSDNDDDDDEKEENDDYDTDDFEMENGPGQGMDYILEFGVWRGSSINLIAKYLPSHPRIFGFDSFEGLPEDWSFPWVKGSFGMEGSLPKVQKNVQLVRGWFNESLPPFIRTHFLSSSSSKHLKYNQNGKLENKMKFDDEVEDLEERTIYPLPQVDKTYKQRALQFKVKWEDFRVQSELEGGGRRINCEKKNFLSDSHIPKSIPKLSPRISLLHIDCDLYSSASFVLTSLLPYLSPSPSSSSSTLGTIIVFDELLNFEGFERHEIRALFEFLYRRREYKWRKRHQKVDKSAIKMKYKNSKIKQACLNSKGVCDWEGGEEEIEDSEIQDEEEEDQFDDEVYSFHSLPPLSQEYEILSIQSPSQGQAVAILLK